MDARQVSIHRGDEYGQVIATTESFQGKDGITEIQLTQVEATVPIRHKHHTLPFMHGYTTFRADGKQYQWKKHRELIDESNGKCLATFERNSDKKSERLGHLTIMIDGQEMIDLIVITGLVDQERGDEGKWTVIDLVCRVLTLSRDRRRPFKGGGIMVKLEFKNQKSNRTVWSFKTDWVWYARSSKEFTGPRNIDFARERIQINFAHSMVNASKCQGGVGCRHSDCVLEIVLLLQAKENRCVV